MTTTTPAWLVPWTVWVLHGKPKGQRPRRAPTVISAAYIWFPAFVQWRMLGGHPSARPKDLPATIPAWAWRVYPAARAALLPAPPPRPPLPPGPPPTGPPVFPPGRGLLAAQEPALALEVAYYLDYVIVTTDNGWADRAVADRLRASGLAVHVWESYAADVALGPEACDAVGASVYVGQAETQHQFDIFVSVAPELAARGIVPGVVANPSALNQDSIDLLRANVTAGRWFLMVEDYWNAQPDLPPDRIDSRGVNPFVPVWGLYDASAEQPGTGRRVLLEQYLARWPGSDWCGYSVEYLAPEDHETLRRLA